MPAHSFSATAVYAHQCSLRLRRFASFPQQRIRTRIANQRLVKRCVRAKLDPTEASEILGMYQAP